MMNNDSWDNSLKTYNNNCEPTIRKDIARMRIMISDGHYSDEKQFNGQFIFSNPLIKSPLNRYKNMDRCYSSFDK